MEIQDEEDESALIGRRFVFLLASSFGSIIIIIIIIRRWSVGLACVEILFDAGVTPSFGDFNRGQE